MAAYVISTEELTAIANAIRAKTKKSATMSPAQMVSEINNIRAFDEDGINAMITRSAGTVTSESATSVGAYAFYNYSALTGVNLPSVTTVGDEAFSGCTSLANAVLGKVGVIGTRAFFGCTSLHSLDLKNATVMTIPGQAFAASGLEELYLPKDVFVGLQSVNAFEGTPFAPGGSGGTLYVPASYRTRYEANSRWNQLLSSENNRIMSY